MNRQPSFFFLCDTLKQVLSNFNNADRLPFVGLFSLALDLAGFLFSSSDPPRGISISLSLLIVSTETEIEREVHCFEFIHTTNSYAKTILFVLVLNVDTKTSWINWDDFFSWIKSSFCLPSTCRAAGLDSPINSSSDDNELLSELMSASQTLSSLK